MTVEQIKQMFEEYLNIREEAPRPGDKKIQALSLLKNRIPFEECPSIIEATDYRTIYLCAVKDAAPYLNKDDIQNLKAYGVLISYEKSNFYMFV